MIPLIMFGVAYRFLLPVVLVLEFLVKAVFFAVIVEERGANRLLAGVAAGSFNMLTTTPSNWTALRLEHGGDPRTPIKGVARVSVRFYWVALLNLNLVRDLLVLASCTFLLRSIARPYADGRGDMDRCPDRNEAPVFVWGVCGSWGHWGHACCFHPGIPVVGACSAVLAWLILHMWALDFVRAAGGDQPVKGLRVGDAGQAPGAMTGAHSPKRQLGAGKAAFADRHRATKKVCIPDTLLNSNNSNTKSRTQ